MHIDAVSYRVPDTVMTNQDVVDLVAEASQEGFEGDFEKTIKTLKRLLRFSGIKTRRMLELHENTFEYISSTIHSALDKAQLQVSDIDLVIHASVDRRVSEPGASFFIANAMGMHRAQCFDVLEACSSWVRATSLSQALLQAGQVKKVLIVTAEFGQHEGEWGRNTYKIDKPEDLDWTFGSYTLGESVSATILSADESKPWSYDNFTMNEFSDLCVIPIGITRPGTMSYGDVSLMGHGAMKFSCQAKKMMDVGWSEVQKMIQSDEKKLDSLDIVFPHSHMVQGWKDIEKDLGRNIPYYFVYPEYGNLITGSIPVAMAMAEEQGKLSRGDYVGGWMSAAGLSITNIDFVY